MKQLFAATVLVLCAGAANAQTATTATAPEGADEVRDACIFVAKNLLMVPDIKVGIVQAFPELEPPGARLTYSTRMDVEESDISDEMECAFTRQEGKLVLLRFCADSTCYASDSEDTDNRRRFAEMQALFERSR
ncbi:hypothetical protein [Peteryoungia ipomoeae]|uniref:Uncharacterized protein n=1 Tax=Peteryoungia ipomoeae TaxID=1210932 RepID=A0A4S8P5X2_9HYPH|nr:hypothetical protein [Peteryoungia ipomoeae]THV25610.1 hypothetical protein FAA97_05345 [Peteryoungia ipomoeae]